ncbi:isopentenyl phosphate kinase, partial [Thermoproteota archaeon]
MARKINQEKTNEIILVKIGGSVITDKFRPFTERRDVIKRLAEEIHSANKDSKYKFIVGHGGGSYPHTPAKKYQVHKGIKENSDYSGISLVQDAAARLNRIVMTALINAGENGISLQPSATILAKSSRIIEWNTKILEEVLKIGLLPVVYGDVVMDIKQGYSIISTEEIFYYLSKKLPVKRIVIGSDVDGVMNNSMNTEEKINIITPSDKKWLSPFLRGAETIDVTGGMKNKVEVLLELAEKYGIESEILNATKP